MNNSNYFLEVFGKLKITAVHSNNLAIQYNSEVMKRFSKTINVFWWIPVGVILILGLVLGASYDLEIAKAVYSKDNLFGIIIECVGSLPGYALVGFVGPLLYITVRDSDKNWLKYLGFAAFFFIPLISGAVYGYDVFYAKLKLIGLFGGAVITLCLDAIFYFFFNRADSKVAFKDACVIALSFGITFIMVFFMKRFIERPRFIYVSEHLDAFKPFLDTSSSLQGVDKDLLDSFPSGHSALASTFLLFPLLSKYNVRTEKHSHFFFLGAALWLLVTMFGRMSDGHHYLSDVSFGALMGTLISFIAYFISEFIKIEDKDEASDE